MGETEEERKGEEKIHFLVHSLNLYTDWYWARPQLLIRNSAEFSYVGGRDPIPGSIITASQGPS